MVTPESIHTSITQGMNALHLSVTGDGQHFEAVVVSEEFEGKAACSVTSGFTKHWGKECAKKFTLCQ